MPNPMHNNKKKQRPKEKRERSTLDGRFKKVFFILKKKEKNAHIIC